MKIQTNPFTKDYQNSVGIFPKILRYSSVALSGVALANRYGSSRVDVSSRWGIRVRRRAEAGEKPEERGDEGGRGRVEEGGRRKVGSLESWRVAGGCWGVQGCLRGGEGGRKEGRFSAGPRSTLTCQEGEDADTRRGWGRLKSVRDEEGCGGHEWERIESESETGLTGSRRGETPKGSPSLSFFPPPFYGFSVA